MAIPFLLYYTVDNKFYILGNFMNSSEYTSFYYSFNLCFLAVMPKGVGLTCSALWISFL